MGKWYYNISSRRGRIVVLSADLSTKSWEDRDLDILIPGDANYVGAYVTVGRAGPSA